MPDLNFTETATAASNAALDVTLDISLGEFPFLADHQVQMVTLLPGALYAALALSAGQRLTTGLPPQGVELRDLTFLRPCSMTEDDAATLRVQFAASGNSWNGTVSGRGNQLIKFTAAKCEPGSLALFQPAATAATTAKACSPAEFYGKLATAGNHYGAGFRLLQTLHCGSDSTAVTLSAPAAVEPLIVHPALLDALVQTVATTVESPAGPYLLAGIGRIAIDLPALDAAIAAGQPLRAVAQTTGAASGAAQLTGDVQLCSASGAVLVAMEAVSLVYPQASPPAGKIGVAATFTAEPLASSIAFWGQHFQTPLEAVFAPYNQVHQQLLDPSSQLAAADNQMNVVLFCWKDWLAGRLQPLIANPQSQQRVQASHDTRKLPAGIEVAHLNPYETDYVFNEIWLDRCYLKHGVTLDDCQCVFDIGANIGLFSLFVKQHAPQAKTYSFEPSPRAHAALTANAEMFGAGSITPLQCGAGEHDSQAEFTFYEASSVFSSFYADAGDDHAAVEAIVANMVRTSLGEDATPQAIDAAVASFMDGRMNSQTLQCELRNVSSIIREHNVTRIDLLKLDAEKSELPVLRGIADEHWPMIRQVVVEVHDREGPVLAEVQSILSSRGFNVEVEEETLLHGSGLFNVFAVRPQQQPAPSSPISFAEDDAAARIEEFTTNVAAFANASSNPLLVISCPPQNGSEDNGSENNGSGSRHMAVEQQVAASLQPLSNVRFVTSAEINRRYPVADIHDPQANQLGHVPYTGHYFAALGATIARHWITHRTPAPKVVVLDCDQTLWTGVCGEDGSGGIVIDQHRAAFQQRMVELKNRGLLLAVSSKNNEADVEAVFAQVDMPLQRNDFTGWKVNWNAKSQNLQQLATELNLGLDSFIFIDDNPLELADVAANCPGVMVLPCPADTSQMMPVLDNLWPLDNRGAVAEDRNRTQMYRDEALRQQALEAAPTLKSFIESLQLQVSITPLEDAQIPRAAQLTQRTNQFNTSTIRRTGKSLQQLAGQGYQSHIVHVQDRFGDYGHTGLVVFKNEAAKLHVDTLLLSCRVLGRGVEHQLLAHLGDIAQQCGAATIEFNFQPTERNQPAHNFLTAHCTGQPLSIDASTAANLKYNPQQAATATASRQPAPQPLAANAFPQQLAHIATHLQTTDQIMAAMQASQIRTRPAAMPAAVEPSGDLEKGIADIWCELLQLDHVGVCDAFKELGGTSLLAVQLIARLKSALNVDLPVVQLFERPTIREIAAYLSNDNTTAATQATAASARERAGRRRARTASRRRK